MSDSWSLVAPTGEVTAAAPLSCAVVKLWVNGKLHELHNPSPTLLLVDFLREQLNLTGTKIGCAEGGCGACTVTLDLPCTGAAGSNKGRVISANSCLRPVVALDGASVTTVEGAGCTKSPHPVQEAMVKECGMQCGFCTPGWVMAMHALLESNETLSAEHLEQQFDGNICRCTGYRPILDAMHSVREKSHCKGQQSHSIPSSLAEYRAKGLTTIHVSDTNARQDWYRVLSVDELKAVAHEWVQPNAEIASGKGRVSVEISAAWTGKGVSKYYPQPQPAGPEWKVYIDAQQIPELQAVGMRKLQTGDEELVVGGAVSIQRVIETLEAKDSQADKADSKSVAFVLKEHLLRIANRQVRNAGTLTGNLVLCLRTGFASDASVALSALDTKLQVVDLSTGVEHRVSLSEFLIEQNAQWQSKPFCVLGMVIPLPTKADSQGATPVLRCSKTAVRHTNSHTQTTFCSLVYVKSEVVKGKDSCRITRARSFLNGATKLLAHLKQLDEALVTGDLCSARAQAWLQQTVFSALSSDIQAEGGGPSTDPRRTPLYRLQLAQSGVFKLLLDVCDRCCPLPPPLRSAIVPFATAQSRPISSGAWTFPTHDDEDAPIHKPFRKPDALQIATGEAQYPSDMQPRKALVAQWVLAVGAVAGKRLTAVDCQEALQVEGVADVLTAADIPQVKGKTKTLSSGEPVFHAAGNIIPAEGVPVALVLAHSRQQCLTAVARVKLHFAGEATARYASGEGRALGPLREAANSSTADSRVVGVEEIAMMGKWDKDNKRAMPNTHPGVDVVMGEPPVDGPASDPAHTVISGQMVAGAQKHFYMETQACCIEPQDNGRSLLCSIGDQNLRKSQDLLADWLGVDISTITCRVRRVGGGFGGKLSRQIPLAAACALAARKHNCPVMAHNDRGADSQFMGGREPITYTYRAEHDDQGVIHNMHLHLDMDCGWAPQDSKGDMGMAVQFSDNVYYSKVFKTSSKLLATKKAINTSCRAPGVMQSLVAHEAVIEHVAASMGLDHEVVMRRNLYQAGQVTPWGDHIGSKYFNWTVPTLLKDAEAKYNLVARKAAVLDFNKANKWKKRGISMTAIKYGLGDDYYSSGCVVAVLMDGSVRLSHGGCELGQGITAKAQQVAAAELGVPIERVFVGDTSTEVVSNNTCTGGSGSSETTAMGVLDACRQIKVHLDPLVKQNNGDVAAAAKAAVSAGIPISAFGWNKTPKAADGGKNTYATYGAAVSEVEVDILTGEVEVRRVDIRMDLGHAFNPFIDIGQLQGGFAMALGWLLTEEVQHAQDYSLLSVGTWEYKPPMAYDIPFEFSVDLASDVEYNPSGVYGSKAVAEPPMGLVSSVYVAVKQALSSHRACKGQHGHFQLDTPLTVDRVRAATLAVAADMELPHC